MGGSFLGAVFDERPDDYAEYIDRAKNSVLDYELQLHQDSGKSEWKSVEDLEKAMSSDSALNDRIRTKQRKKFIDSASYMFPNPALYDAEGNLIKKGPDGKNKTIMVSANRKVWRRQKHLRTAKAMERVPTWDELKSGTLEQWIAVMRKMETQYEWNPFTFVDGATGYDGRAAASTY